MLLLVAAASAKPHPCRPRPAQQSARLLRAARWLATNPADKRLGVPMPTLQAKGAGGQAPTHLPHCLRCAMVQPPWERASSSRRTTRGCPCSWPTTWAFRAPVPLPCTMNRGMPGLRSCTGRPRHRSVQGGDCVRGAQVDLQATSASADSAGTAWLREAHERLPPSSRRQPQARVACERLTPSGARLHGILDALHGIRAPQATHVAGVARRLHSRALDWLQVQGACGRHSRLRLPQTLSLVQPWLCCGPCVCTAARTQLPALSCRPACWACKEDSFHRRAQEGLQRVQGPAPLHRRMPQKPAARPLPCPSASLSWPCCPGAHLHWRCGWSAWQAWQLAH